MAQDLADIVHPLVDSGKFEDAEAAVKELMADYVLRQVDHYRNIIQGFEQKYGQRYSEFCEYLRERSRLAKTEPSLHKQLMREEEDELEWKIATEMLESWLGINPKSSK